MIFLHVTTRALSSTVFPVVQRAKVPVTILDFSPEPAIDYASFNKMTGRTAMTGEWLAQSGRVDRGRPRGARDVLQPIR